jgi:hypothetical protein
MTVMGMMMWVRKAQRRVDMNALVKMAIGSLAVVTAAQAQIACPADTVVSVVEVPGYSCTVEDKTFSAFTLGGVPADARIQFGKLGSLFAVTLSRDGSFFPTGTVMFDYTVTPVMGSTIREGTVGVDVSFPFVATTSVMNGRSLSPSLILNGGTGEIQFTPGVNSVVVDDTLHIVGAGELNSISNDFAQVIVSVVEPDDLVLWAIGLGGLVLVWRRRRAD